MAPNVPGKIIVSAPDQEDQIIILDQPVLRIGRLPAPDNDVTLTHGLVSRRHVQIFCDRLPYRITDLGSSNGTLVNDIPLPPNEVRELRSGDVIAIGPFSLRYEAPQVEAAPPPEPEPEPEEEKAPPKPKDKPKEEKAPAEPPPEEPFGGLRVQEAPAPPPPREPPSGDGGPLRPETDRWVGMPLDRGRWLQYLPYMYTEHSFLGRYLLIFEDLFGPLDQAIGHFNLFLDPRTAPESFLGVLAGWLGLVLDDRWPAEQRRAILRSAVELYDFRGTKSGLTRLLEASTACEVEIDENTDGPHSFRVVLKAGKNQEVDEGMVRHLIDTNKPAHTVYKLQVKKGRK
jgi:phage tail-like protein